MTFDEEAGRSVEGVLRTLGALAQEVGLEGAAPVVAPGGA
jgi:hypothetical protein